MSADGLRVSVVIPTLNRCEELGATLAALATQTLAPEVYEVIVVRDGSTDGTIEMLEQLRPRPRLLIARQPHVHYQHREGRHLSSLASLAVHPESIAGGLREGRAGDLSTREEPQLLYQRGEH